MISTPHISHYSRSFRDVLITRELKNNININKNIYPVNLLLAFNFCDFLINLI